MTKEINNYFTEYFHQIEKMASRIHKIAKKNTTPFYIYDEKEVKNNLSNFKKAFQKEKTDINIFYAIKSNPYLGLLKTIVDQGEGLDASSTRELKLAIKAGAKKIIYTGPAKEKTDFELILKHCKKITINLESFRELKLIAGLTQKAGKKIKCGLRIVTKNQSGWNKFGLPLNMLKKFYDEASQYKYIQFCGLHFHISMNKNAQTYVNTLIEIKEYLETHFCTEDLKKFEYIDIGGGFYPNVFEGIPTYNPEQSMKFFDADIPIDNIINDEFQPRYKQIKVDSIEKIAKEISKVWKSQIKKLLPNANLYSEPGRFICHSCMHILIKLIDIKDKHIGISNGGMNMIGWEKYQFFNYVPLFNLSNFSVTKEIPFITYGSLCTPDDIWGYYLYTKGQPKEGDILLMPFQGAYTYTLAQNFIKDIPPVYNLI